MNEEQSHASNIPTLEEPITRCGRVARKSTRCPCVNAAANSIVHDHVSNMKEIILMHVDSESSTCSPKIPLVHETGLTCVVIGSGFENTGELGPMKHKKSINGPVEEKWAKAIDEEWEISFKNNVLKAVNRKDVPKDEKIITSTWAMKKKARGLHRARTNARGFEQTDGMHF